MKRGRTVAAIMAVVVFGALLAGCFDTTNNPPSAFCGLILGDGEDGEDTRIHEIVWPNQNVDYDEDSEVVKYFPCNSRNFIINNGKIRNANGDRVGDRFTPSVVYTSSGTPIKVWTSSQWTLNQDEAALEKFWDVCQKYNCATEESRSGNANYSTPGWNGMLGENFAVSVDAALLESASTIDDAVWQKHDAALYEQLGEAASAVFKDKVRGRTGYNVDLYCGSGNSRFRDEENHEGFQCSNVRIIVDKVQVVNQDLGDQATKATQAEQEQETNAKIRAAAEILYGPLTNQALAMQDAIKACQRRKQTTCVINFGSGAVSFPLG